MRVLSLSPALWLAACAGGPVAPARPNVLIVTLDTTRADVLGAYGGPAGVSPHFDRLASEGLRFERAQSVTPLTIPAHSSLFTGLFPPRHGVRDNGDAFLSPEATTLAERLKSHGYTTAAAVGAEVTSHHWGFAQGFDAYFDNMGEKDADGEKNRWRVERPGRLVVDDALGWLQAQPAAGAPWFLWVHLFDAHHPYEAPPDAAAAFPGRPYAAEVFEADRQVGRLLEALTARGELDETAIVVLADHGEALGAHGEQFHGVLLYEETIRIPLVLRPPGGRSGGGATTAAPVSTVDIVPTVLQLTGAPAADGIDGRDLSPLLGDPASPAFADRTVYAESLYAWHHYGWAPQRALISATEKLIDSTTPELYANDDRGERTNLAPGAPDRVSALYAAMDALAATLVPAAGAAAKAALSAEHQAQLEALGYMTAGAAEGEAPFRGTLPDPVTRLPVLAEIENVRKSLQAGDLPAARAAAEKVIAAEPGLEEPVRMLAHVLANEGRLDEALARLAELEARRPTAAGKVQMAGLHLRKGDPEGALTLLDAAIAQDPYLEGAWPPYLFTLFTRGDIPRFAAAVARGRAALPDNALIAGFAGLHAAMSGNAAEARPLLVTGIAADPGAPFLHHGLGMVERAEERLDEAESALLEEVRLHPPAVPSRRVLVEIYAEQKRYAEQLAQLDALMAVEPPHLLNSHARAQALFNLKRFPESLDEVLRCRKLDPRYPACAMLEANALKKLGREKEAYTAYEAALALVGQTPKPPPTPGTPAGTPAGTPTAADAVRDAITAPATP